MRPLLLLFLWVWALCIFVTLDLFLNVSEFDAIRPKSESYRALRQRGHGLVGEPYLDGSPEPPPRPGSKGAAAIEGVVQGPGGRTVSGARVAARDVETSAWIAAEADGEGEFLLAAERGHAYDLAATGAGHGIAVMRHVEAPARLTLVLGSAGRIAGRVLDAAGDGVGGVLLRLERGRAPEPAEDYLLGPDFRDLDSEEFIEPLALRSATTGPDGAFAFHGVELGHHDIVVEEGPVRVGGRSPVHVPGPIEVSCEVRVERAEPLTVRGRVLDAETGRPVAGAEVAFAAAGTARTDARGAFEMGSVPPGLVRIEVRTEGRPRLRWEDRIGEPPPALELHAPAGRSVSGRMLDPGGEPVVGARVQWLGTEGDRAEARADGEGRFRLDGIAADHNGLLRATAHGFAEGEVHVPIGIEEIDIPLADGARLEGRVVKRDGSPGAGVLVLLVPGLLAPSAGATAMNLRDVRRTRADSHGRYAFEDLSPGTIAVVACPDDLSLAPAILGAEAPGSATDLVLRPARALEGDVVDPQGHPIAGALVRVASRIRPGLAVTDAAGRFILVGRPELDERVLVTAPGHVAAVDLLRPPYESPLRFRLAPARPGG